MQNKHITKHTSFYQHLPGKPELAVVPLNPPDFHPLLTPKENLWE